MKPKDLLLLCILLLLPILTPAHAGVAMEPVSRWESRMGAVVASGNRAYVTIDDRLAVLDVTSPSAPVQLGISGTLAGGGASMVVSGSYAYVVGATYGLQVLNISNPASPVLVGACATGGSAVDIAVSGNYAYVAARTAGLKVVDISNPAAPVVVGTCSTSGDWPRVAVSGNYAYVAEDGVGLQVIDISNPTAPTWAALCTQVGVNSSLDARDVAVSGNYAYVTGWHWEGDYRPDTYAGVDVINISNPLSPTRVGRCSMDNYGYSTPNTQMIEVSGVYAYVSGGGTGLRVVYVGNPGSPTQVGTLTVADPGHMAVSGDSVYMSDSDYGLRIVDVSTPSAPTVLGAYVIASSLPRCADISGNYAYIADQISGLHILDISDPALPVRIGGCPGRGTSWTVAVSGNYAYLGDYSSSQGLDVIDISNPAAPTLVGHCNPGAVHDMVVAGSYVYTVDGRNLRVISVANPAAPTIVSTFAPGGYTIDGVAVSGNYAYVGSGSVGLRVVDISNPAAPANVGLYNTSGTATDVAVVSSYAYVADGSSGLQIINVSNPAAPVRVGGYDTTGYVCDVVVSGNYAYVADSEPGVVAIDISNPASPTYAGGCNTGPSSSDQTQTVLVSGDYAYVTDTGDGFVALQIAGFPPPTVTSITPNSGLEASTVSITNLAGTGLLSGATVKLKRAGQSDIVATGVTRVDPTKITCTFNLIGRTPGIYDLVVANADGQSATLAGAFTILEATPPQINSIVLDPARVASGDTVYVTVDATDNVGVASVTANGTALSYAGGSIWSGSISATSALGQHSVMIIANDAVGNPAADDTGVYTTAQVLLAVSRDLAGQVWAEAASTYLFGTIGKVISVDGDVFELSDGSGALIRVSYPGHGLLVNDYAIAHGAWDLTASPHVLNATRVTKL